MHVRIGCSRAVVFRRAGWDRRLPCAGGGGELRLEGSKHGDGGGEVRDGSRVGRGDAALWARLVEGDAEAVRGVAGGLRRQRCEVVLHDAARVAAAAPQARRRLRVERQRRELGLRRARLQAVWQSVVQCSPVGTICWSVRPPDVTLSVNRCSGLRRL